MLPNLGIVTQENFERDDTTIVLMAILSDREALVAGPFSSQVPGMSLAPLRGRGFG
jgi:hypothetical protein